MKRIVFYADEETKKKLRDEAHRQEKTQVELMTRFIRENCSTDEEFLRAKKEIKAE